MESGAIFFGLIILAGMLPYLMAPFRQAEAPRFKLSARQADQAERRQDSLRALRDLDFDYRTGKVNEEDYPSLRAGLLAEAGEFIRQEQAEDDALEMLIAARRAGNARLNTLRQTIPNATGFCPACGQKVYATDRFCTACGIILQNQADSGQ